MKLLRRIWALLNPPPPRPADPQELWGTEEAYCDRCGYAWIAVHPCLEYITCPICKSLVPSILDLTKLPELDKPDKIS